jgi:hypothetical protein
MLFMEEHKQRRRCKDMQAAIYLSEDEMRLVSAALKQERARSIDAFDLAQNQPDLVSQRRAVRIAKEVKSLHKVINQIDELQDQSFA